jgi:hypothetical protein
MRLENQKVDNIPHREFFVFFWRKISFAEYKSTQTFSCHVPTLENGTKRQLSEKYLQEKKNENENKNYNYE